MFSKGSCKANSCFPASFGNVMEVESCRRALKFHSWVSLLSLLLDCHTMWQSGLPVRLPCLSIMIDCVPLKLWAKISPSSLKLLLSRHLITASEMLLRPRGCQLSSSWLAMVPACGFLSVQPAPYSMCFLLKSTKCKLAGQTTKSCLDICQNRIGPISHLTKLSSRAGIDIYPHWKDLQAAWGTQGLNFKMRTI